jgi:hypothetical protein
MDSSGPTPHVGLDCSDLQGVLSSEGPFLTVYLTTEPGENAAQHTAERWKALRQEAETDGVPNEALEAVEPLLRDAHKGARCLCVVTDSTGRIRHQSQHPDPPTQDLHRWGPIPSLVPVVEWRQSSPPHVIVLIDRVGADIVAFEAFGGRDFQLAVEGEEDTVRKVAPGGWSQRRYQQRAENTWEANAKEVADKVARIVNKIGARLVVLAGDVRAVQLMRESLPSEVNALVRKVDGSRHPDGSVDAVSDAAVKLVATVVAEDTAALLAKFREEVGQHDRAANGPEEVVAALEAGQVEVLLVHDDPGDERTAWIGPEPFHIALDAKDLKAMGVDSPTEVRLVDALLRAAAGTSATVRVVPSATVLDGGAGAILRWSANGNGNGVDQTG